MELKGKVVTVLPQYISHDLTDSRFLCEDGFGCSSFTNGSTIYGKWLVDGERDTIKGFMVEKLVE